MIRSVIKNFISGWKLNISLLLLLSYSSYSQLLSEDVRLNTTYFFIMKIQTDESFNKLSLIIHVILASINLKRFTEKEAKTIEGGRGRGGGGDNLKQYSHISAMYQINKIYGRLKETAEIQNSTKVSNLNYSASRNN